MDKNNPWVIKPMDFAPHLPNLTGALSEACQVTGSVLEALLEAGVRIAFFAFFLRGRNVTSSFLAKPKLAIVMPNKAFRSTGKALQMLLSFTNATSILSGHSEAYQGHVHLQAVSAGFQRSLQRTLGGLRLSRIKNPQ